MKQLPLLLFFCLFGLIPPLGAQAPDVEWINISGTVKGAYQHKVLGADVKGFYVYQSSGRERAIEKYNYNGGLVYSHKIPLDDRSIEIEELLVRKEDVIVFFSIFNSSLRKHGLFYMIIPHQGEPQKPVILMDTDGIGNRTRSYFKITPNEDLSGFNCIHEHRPRPDEMTLEIVFYDAMIRPISNTKLILPMSTERYELLKVVNDPEHHAYVLFRTINVELKNADPEKEAYKLLKVNRFTLQADELKLGSSLYHLNAMEFAYDRLHRKMVLAGFYSLSDRSQIAGLVLARINPQALEFDTIGYGSFDTEFTQRIVSYKSSKKEKELTDYFLRDLILRDDGGVVLMAESNYQTNQTFVQYSQGFPIYREVVYYHYDEIVLVSANPDGTVDWRQIIPKNQTSVSPSPEFSYTAFASLDHINILFNEEGRSKSNVALYSISNTGNVVPRNVLSAETNEANIVPSDARIISPNTILVPANKRKKKGVFRLTFDGI